MIGSALPDPARTLDAEVAAYGLLLGLLQVEQQALLAADPGAVAASVAEKARQVESLRELARERTDALRRAGKSPDATGMAAWLAEPGQTPHARALWAELESRAAEGRARNTLNGHLIATQQRHWDRAASALWQAAGMAPTYGADGRARHNHSPRTRATISI